ncbi:MAG: Peptidase M16 domain protein [Berkelbacteria bacterium GW2011_GWB1_38_5]|uniref:Peptidase M16 domain protein n=2 Tax=Candidatus Berkelbacteria TaxID=1618330 RepID=A0A0G0IRP2_9BACT|nr:MAG: Peptidase M16 domain protein [Berkelbacteria bacterium GW2011_GWA1_36_9]KKQ73869.1 MAG: Peptidase M16 domain protein [Berkelbacteria bacterium GW2011_GWB1_38_5]
MLNYKLTTLPNGLKLITAPLENTKAVTVLFLIGVGSRYENKNLNGISHFLEHLFFKGTKKRPKTLDIAKALDAVGASYNAFTSEEHTGFFVRAASEHFELALDILFDMLYNSAFLSEEIEREKGVIVEEINMYQDLPQSYISEVAKQLFYGDQPLGWQTTGLKETVQKFSREDFVSYRDKFYTPENMIVAVAGGKNNVSWQEKIQEFFAKVEAKRKEEYLKIKENQTKPGLKMHFKKTDQAHLILGFRTPARSDKRRPVLKVLNNLFGETMSSRLFTEVREKRGLAYYVSSEMADFQDTGIFGASAGVDILRAKEAVKVILEEFNKLKTKDISAEELKRAKENLKGRMYLGLEESFAVAEFLAEQQLFWGKIEHPEEIISKYEKVTASDIKKFAKEYFVPKNLNLAMISPFKNTNEFEKILERF